MIRRDELLEQFLVEGRELVVRGRRELAALAGSPADRDALGDLFRSLHTLKGSTGLFALAPLTRLLHAAEAQLDQARAEGRLAPRAADGVGRALDEAERWLEVLEQGGEPAADLARRAEALAARLQGAAPPAEHALAANPPAAADWARALAAKVRRQGPLAAIRYTPAGDAYFRGDDPLAIVRQIPGLLRLQLAADPPAAELAYDPFRCALTIEALSEAPLSEVRQALRLVFDQVELVPIERAAPAAGLRLRALRVDAGRLDGVAALVDELVIAKNALAHQTAQTLAASGQAREVAARQAALERVVGELHAAITGLRLASLSHLFSRFPRQVRELAESLGKDVDLLVAGEQVALDKSVVEGLFEPVLHLLRNAIDHGVEPPAARRAAGKAERARITITAQAQAEEVVVEIADDGRGIDPERVRRAATARGVISAAAAAALSDEAAVRLVFAPGFSTKGGVSDISGRGVGMDAVHAAVTRMGGRVALENRSGEGLTVRLILPAQVILTKILVVKAGGERFGVPLDTVSETHRVRLDEVTRVRAGRVFVRRGEVIPLLSLAELLGGPPPQAEVFPVLCLGVESQTLGVQIDEIGERLEAPLRPMSGLMSAYPGLLGTVLEGDGRVLLVLDLAELAA